MKPVSKTAKRDLLERYRKKPSNKLRDEIVMSYISLVEYIARKFSYHKEEVEDLVQVGTIGLMKAVENFSPERDVEFTTYATPKIIGEIKHYFRDKSKLIKVPRKLQELNSKIRTFTKKFSYDAGASPTVAQICEGVGCSEEEVLEAMEINQSYSTLSLDSPSFGPNSKDGSQSSVSLIDSLGEDSSDEFVLDQESLRQALKTLEAREQRIIYLRFFDNLTQVEIAERLNLSQMHISRLLTHSLRKVHRAMKR